MRLTYIYPPATAIINIPKNKIIIELINPVFGSFSAEALGFFSILSTVEFPDSLGGLTPLPPFKSGVGFGFEVPPLPPLSLPLFPPLPPKSLPLSSSSSSGFGPGFPPSFPPSGGVITFSLIFL